MRWLAIALVVVALAGCTDEKPDAPCVGEQCREGGTEDEPQDPGPEESAPDEPAPSNDTLRDPVTWDVEVRDNSFSPADLTIQAGDSVRFVYVGTNPHTATADNGEFDSGDCPGTTCFQPGIGRTEFTWTSDAVGDVPYVCEVHGNMRGTIAVLERHDATP